MGLCLSCRCGESHPKSSLLPLSTPHPPPSSSPSLTTFLHLWTSETTDTTDTTSETTNKVSQYPLRTAPPVDDYSHLIIPHSSELFSLPSSDAGSIARSSTSSSSLSWSMEHPKPNIQSTNQPKQPRGSNAARRKSCSSLGQQDVLPEHWHKKSLANTIARLEKFCDVKFFLENRRSSQSWVVPRSNSDYGSTILVQESCRDFAQKLLWFANDHSGGMFSRSDGDAKCEVVVTNKQTESETVPAGETSFRRDAENFYNETVPEVANFLRDTENLESNVPVVASFLRDAENFQSDLDAGETPVMSRLPSLRFCDGEESIQFTEFEATFELLAAEMSALHSSAEADQASGASISTENVAPGLAGCQYAHRQSWTRSDLGGGRQFKQKGLKSLTSFRSALSDISSNGTPADEPLGRKNHQPLTSQTSTGVLKRGGSRSLDLQNCSLSHLEFDKILKCERWQLPQAETLCRGEPQRIETEESQRTEVADSATIEQLAGEEASAPSPSGNSAPSQSQPTKGRVSVCGGGELEERFPESVCTDDANGGDETPILHDNSDKSLSQNFDKLPEIPPGEFASEDTSQLPEATTDTLDFSADGAQTAEEAAADCRLLRSCENENWREAPASLGNTVQSELPDLHEPDCFPETLPGALSID